MEVDEEDMPGRDAELQMGDLAAKPSMDLKRDVADRLELLQAATNEALDRMLVAGIE